MPQREENFNSRLLDGVRLELGTGSEHVADAYLTHSGANMSVVNTIGNVTIDNQSATGFVHIDLGTDTSATGFRVRNNSGTALLEVKGDGSTSFALDGTNDTEFIVNEDATAASNEDPTLTLKGGDGEAAPNDDLVISKFSQDSSLEHVEFSTTRQRNAGATVYQSPAFHVGRLGEVTVSLDASVHLNASTDGGAARRVQFQHLGQEHLLEISSPTAALDVSLLGTGVLGIRASSADANPSAGLSGSQLSLGAGGASAPDVIIARTGANVAGVAAGDTWQADTIAEVTGAAGVTVDGVKLKDGDVIVPRFVYASITATGAAGSNDGTLSIQLKTLDGVNIALEKKVRVIASSVDGDNVADASISFSAATAGSIVATGTGYAEVLTDATGLFACTLTNTADDTTYVGVVHSVSVASGGTLAQGCLVIPAPMDSATWTV